MNWSRHPVDSRDGDGRAPGKWTKQNPDYGPGLRAGSKKEEKRIKVSVAAKGEAPRVWNKGVS